MSYYERNQSRSRPPVKRAENWAKKPLSNPQKAKLSIAAKAAWQIQVTAGLDDGSFEDWKHAQNKIACGFESIRDATNSQFRSILGHFLKLSGKTSEAKKIWKTTGRVTGSSEIHDTHENRETARVIIRDIIEKSAGRINDDYVTAIITDKHAGRPYLDLTAKDLQQLVFTLKTRLRTLKNLP